MLDRNSISESTLVVDWVGYIFRETFSLDVFGVSIECSSCSCLGHCIGAIIGGINSLDRDQILFTPIL